MAELAVNQMIMMGIAVLVLIVVLVGAGLAFYNYIYPDLKGYGFEDKRNLESSYYINLMKSENAVGVTDGTTKTPYIIFNGVKSSYYFSEKRDVIKEDINWKIDPVVAQIDANYKIRVNADYLAKDSRLKVIDGGELIGREIYKQGGTGTV